MPNPHLNKVYISFCSAPTDKTIIDRIWFASEVRTDESINHPSIHITYQAEGFGGYLLTELIKEEESKVNDSNNSMTITVDGSSYTYTTATNSNYNNSATTTTTTNLNYNNSNSATTITSPTYTYVKADDWNIASDLMNATSDLSLTYKNGNVYIGDKKVLTEEDSKEKENKEEDNMENMKFEFGPVTNRDLAICPFGIAVRNATDSTWCYYDPVKCEVIDCTPFKFETGKFLYSLPVAVNAIEIGDVIMHRGTPMFVKGYADEEGRILVVDVAAAEEKLILPVKNMFGFNYITKVVSLLDMRTNGACPDNPFGNMLPMMMLMGEGKELDPMMLLMLNRNKNAFGAANLIGLNPMMMYLLMKDNKNMKDILPFLIMTSCQQPAG